MWDVKNVSRGEVGGKGVGRRGPKGKPGRRAFKFPHGYVHVQPYDA